MAMRRSRRPPGEPAGAASPIAVAAGEAASSRTMLLARLFALVREASGVDFELYKPATIERRVQRRMIHHRFTRLDEYVSFLETHPSERGRCARRCWSRRRRSSAILPRSRRCGVICSRS
jgi:hypothetical protein